MHETTTQVDTFNTDGLLSPCRWISFPLFSLEINKIRPDKYPASWTLVFLIGCKKYLGIMPPSLRSSVSRYGVGRLLYNNNCRLQCTDLRLEEVKYV